MTKSLSYLKMVFSHVICPRTRAYVQFLQQVKGVKKRDIAKICKVSLASVYRIGKEDFSKIRRIPKKKFARIGRPRKLTERDERLLLRQILVLRRDEGGFTVRRLMKQAGISLKDVSCKTVRRLLKRNGYQYLQARKKGVLTDKDRKKRLNFARKMKKKYSQSVWTKQIAFYLDGISFFHKYNPADQARSPKGRVWRRSSEGLALGCTAKGSHVGSGGRTVKIMVAVTFGEGVVLCEQYEKLNGEFFKGLVERNFLEMFKNSKKSNSRMWIQDGDPSQNSALARKAMSKVGAELLAIPPRSPDINPIENIFHILKNTLDRDALQRNITRENFEEYSNRVVSTIKNVDTRLIDKTIDSMNKRMDLIIDNNGNRIKY